MENNLKFGVIGCGLMAKLVHCPNMKAISGVELTAYCDVEEEKAKELLAQFGGEYATAHAEQLFADESLDGLLIQVGPRHHAELVRKAAAAGKHVFVEKPIAIHLHDALATMEAVEKANIKLMYGTCNRLAPNVKRAKSMCPKPLYTYCQCSDTVTHQAVHNIDLAVNLFHESPLKSVYASGMQAWNMDPHLPADSFSAILTFEDNSVHTYIQHGGSYNPLLKKYHYQLFGQDNCVYLAKRFKECHLMTDRDKVDKSWIFEGDDTDRGPQGYMGHFDELQEWVQAIRIDGSCTMTARDAVYVLAVEKAILESVETGQVIMFREYLKSNNLEKLLG